MNNYHLYKRKKAIAHFTKLITFPILQAVNKFRFGELFHLPNLLNHYKTTD